MQHSSQTTCNLLKAPQFESALQLALVLALVLALAWWAVLVWVRPQL